VSRLFHRTSCTPTESNLDLAIFLATVASDLTFHVWKLFSLFRCLGCTKGSVQARGICSSFVIRRGFRARISTSPNSHLEDHPLSVVRDCLFNIFAAILHTGVRSSICNLSTRHAVVTRTHLSWSSWCIPLKYALGWSAVVLCACEIMLFFSVLFG
jgi:hypothetical protein